MSRRRRVLATFAPAVIVPLLVEASRSPFHAKPLLQLPSGHAVRLSRTLRCLAVHGTRCVGCGAVCDRFELVTGLEGVALHAMISSAVPRARGQKRGEYGWAARLTADHRVPRSLGGSDILANLRTACEICNSRRGARPEAGVQPEERFRLASLKDAARARCGEDDPRWAPFFASYLTLLESQRERGDPALGYLTRTEVEMFTERMQAEFGLTASAADAPASLCPGPSDRPPAPR